MDLTNDREMMEQIRIALLKPQPSRSYDDLLLLKSYISKTELITKDLAGIVNPRQMNDICRSLGLESYDVGQIVFQQGDVGDRVYIVLQGKCDVRVRYKIDLTQGQSETREKYIVTYTSGQFFGERALQFDEPRSATVTALEHTYLVTLHKTIYMSVLNEAKRDVTLNLKLDQFGTKEGVIKLLSKVREKRSAQELGAVAQFLYRRIPFFQKFTMQQLIELCRVAETVTIWGRSILFKQGQIGQAFYVILSGNVEVWVNDGKQQPIPQTSSSLGKKGTDLTEGLGAKVNQLVTGDVFGERALENESSMRMASIITGEDSTDLLVISKEDYHNLVYVMMHEDSMHKLQLLRKTDIFASLDVVHLRALARFMEPKKFQINEEVASVGKKATEIVIIEKGECRAITEISEEIEQPQHTDDERVHHYMVNTEAHHNQEVTVHHHHHHIIPDDPTQKSASTAFTTEHNHQLRRKNKKKLAEEAKKVDILELSTKDLKKNTALQPLMKTASSTKLANIEEEQHSPVPEGMEEKKTSNRKLTKFSSQEQSGPKKRKLDLGRIAPNSVIAPYVVLCDNILNDVFHPETIVAASLVSTYVITKHDFLTHVPKDSRVAVIKLVRKYKAPVLNPLWESTPRVLDDNQWRLEKAWEKFRSDFTTTANKEANILDSLKAVSKVHLSLNSGNDQSKIKRIDSTDTNQGKAVTIDWGLPLGMKTETGRKTPNGSSSRIGSPKHMNSANIGAQPQQQTLSPPQQKQILESEATLKSRSVTDLIEASTVANIIRKRLNQSHSQEAMLRATNNIGSLDPLANANAMKSKIAQASTEDGGQASNSNNNKLIELPFVMIQVHREYARTSPTGGAIQGNRRLLKSYLRICGAFPSISKAKEMADKQLENIFLTLYQSNPTQQDELLLNWNTFRGFESILVNDSDHFIIYCRSSPMEYASIFPSKNILFSPFPAICRLANQRYAVTVMNQIISDENPLMHGNSTSPTKKKKQIVIGSKVKSSHKKEVMIGLAGSDGVGLEGDEEVHDANHPPDHDSDEEDQDNNGASNKTASNKVKKMASSRKLSSMGVSSNNVMTSSAKDTSGRQTSRKGGMSNGPSETPTSGAEVVGFPIGAAQTESAISLPEFIGTKKSSWPLYLQELSCMYESLVISSTRLESLRYAIRRFGTMPSEILSRASSNMMGDTGGTMASTGFTDSTNPESNNMTSSSTGNGIPSSVIQLKSINESNKGDRILRIVHNEQKKICVLPLFKWILLNEETVDTLNFVYAFKESTIRKILLAEELDQTQEENAYDEDEDDAQLLGLQGNDQTEQGKKRYPGEYRDLISEIEEKHLHPEMVKSFSEAGFIPNDPLQTLNTKALDEGLHRSQSTTAISKVSRSDGILFIDNNNRNNTKKKIEVIADQARALKILETEIASREMSKQIHSMQSQFMTMQNTTSSYKMSMGSSALTVPMSPPRVIEDDAHSSSSATTGRVKSQKDSVQLEQRLKALTRTVNETGRILSTHDQLCELEHGTPTKKGEETTDQVAHDHDSANTNESSFEPSGVRKQFVSPKGLNKKKVIPKEEKLRLTKDNKSGIMQERLNVIESLQKLHFVPSRAAASTNNGPAIQPASVTMAAGPATVAGNAAVSALFGLGKNQGPTTQSTAAGRRLAESLKILSESLDQQLQQKMTISASQPQL